MVDFRPAARVAALPPNFFGAMDRRIAETAATAGPRVINVSKGNPDLPTPEHIVTAMQGSVADPRNHGYPAYAPKAPVRDAIVHRYRVDHGVELDPETNLAVFHGSHEAFMAAVLAIADPGDTVVLPDPGYPIYDSAVGLAGAVSTVLPLIEPDYQPDFAALETLPSAAALLLNYPNNPTGALAAAGTFEGALIAAERLGAAFIHDFAYASLGFDGHRPRSALTADPGLERTVEVSTLSKTYSMAGWRFGFAVGNASLIAAMRRYQSHAYSTIFAATQEAAAAALAGDQTAADELVAVYERRRDRLVGGLRRLGWTLAAPEGTFFVWARVPDGTDDVAFAERLLEHGRIAVAPGSGFGSRGRGWIRFGLVVDEPTIDELLERLAALEGDHRPCASAAAEEGRP